MFQKAVKYQGCNIATRLLNNGHFILLCKEILYYSIYPAAVDPGFKNVRLYY
jgi:hypothetical protein